MWGFFKKRFAPETKDIRLSSSDVEAVFGSLRSDPKRSNLLVGSFSIGRRAIELRIDPDDRTLEECHGVARELLTRFQDMNGKALSVASDTLLSNYNENWRDYSEKQEDGSYVDVSRPELDRSAFEESIRITCVSVIGTMVEFLYSDEGLFHGHTIVVSSFDGLDFSDTNAVLFG